jgi:formyl-CoA transferase/CoA:oxalate CoA-transferase
LVPDAAALDEYLAPLFPGVRLFLVDAVRITPDMRVYQKAKTMLPLEHIRVCDLSRILSGPYCTMVLGDMGAEVIKVEPPQGDDTRGWGPPFMNGESAYFLSINRNKKSIQLDLKTPEGKSILEKIIRKSDVLVENFRTGTMARLGFGYDAVCRLNPRLVYCSITGYGQTGPRAFAPGYDVVVQGESGAMDLTGFPDGPPTKFGLSIADIVTGMNAVQGILLALLTREKIGRGQHIDIALLDSMVACLAYQAQNHFAGSSPTRLGNRHPSIVPYETFEAADGFVNIGVGTEGLWKKFCDAVGLETLGTDPRFAANTDRLKNYAALRPLLAERVKMKSRLEWQQILEKAGVPCGQIRTVKEVFSDPQLQSREMIAQVVHPTIGNLRLTGIPIKLSETPGAVRLPPPRLDEHREEILALLA